LSAEASTSAESLNCPNCGAPLPDPAGRPTLVCDHCGSVIALKPPQAAPAEPSAPAPAEIDPHYDYGPQPARRPARSDLTSVALGPADAAQVIQLLRDGRVFEAIQFYQSKVGGSLGESRDAISAIQSGLQDAGASVGAGAFRTSANPADLPEVMPQDLGGSLAAAPRPMLAPARTRNRSCFGCSIAGLGVVALLLCILGGCGGYLQTTAIYKCSLRDVKAALAAEEILTQPINGGYLVVVGGFDQTNRYLSAEYFAPVWGANGWGIVDAHIEDSSSGRNTVSARLYKDGQWRPVLPSGQIPCQP